MFPWCWVIKLGGCRGSSSAALPAARPGRRQEGALLSFTVIQTLVCFYRHILALTNDQTRLRSPLIFPISGENGTRTMCHHKAHGESTRMGTWVDAGAARRGALSG